MLWNLYTTLNDARVTVEMYSMAEIEGRYKVLKKRWYIPATEACLTHAFISLHEHRMNASKSKEISIINKIVKDIQGIHEFKQTATSVVYGLVAIHNARIALLNANMNERAEKYCVKQEKIFFAAAKRLGYYDKKIEVLIKKLESALKMKETEEDNLHKKFKDASNLTPDEEQNRWESLHSNIVAINGSNQNINLKTPMLQYIMAQNSINKQAEETKKQIEEAKNKTYGK